MTQILLKAVRYVPLPEDMTDTFVKVRATVTFSFFSIILYPISLSFFNVFPPWMMKGAFLDKHEFNISLLSPTFEYSTTLMISHDYNEEMCVEGLTRVHRYVKVIKHLGAVAAKSHEYRELLVQTRALEELRFDCNAETPDDDMKAIIDCLFFVAGNHPNMMGRTSAISGIAGVVMQVSPEKIAGSTDILTRKVHIPFSLSRESSLADDTDKNNPTTPQQYKQQEIPLLDLVSKLIVTEGKRDLLVLKTLIFAFVALTTVERNFLPEVDTATHHHKSPVGAKPLHFYDEVFDFFSDLFQNGEAQKHLPLAVFLHLTTLIISFLAPKDRRRIPYRAFSEIHKCRGSKFKHDFWNRYRDSLIVPLMKHIETKLSLVSELGLDLDDQNEKSKKIEGFCSTWPKLDRQSVAVINVNYVVILSGTRHPRLWFDECFEGGEQTESWKKDCEKEIQFAQQPQQRGPKPENFILRPEEEESVRKMHQLGHRCYEHIPLKGLARLFEFLTSNMETPSETLGRFYNEELAWMKKRQEDISYYSGVKEDKKIDDDNADEPPPLHPKFDGNSQVDHLNNEQTEFLYETIGTQRLCLNLRSVLAIFFRSMFEEYTTDSSLMQSEIIENDRLDFPTGIQAAADTEEEAKNQQHENEKFPLLFKDENVLKVLVRCSFAPFCPSWAQPSLMNSLSLSVCKAVLQTRANDLEDSESEQDFFQKQRVKKMYRKISRFCYEKTDIADLMLIRNLTNPTQEIAKRNIVVYLSRIRSNLVPLQGSYSSFMQENDPRKHFWSVVAYVERK